MKGPFMDKITYEGVEYALPFADLIRPLNKSERLDLSQSLNADGPKSPVLEYDSPTHGPHTIIDGQTRTRLCAAGKIPGLKFVRLDVTDAVAVKLAVDLNAARRQMTDDDIREARAERVKRVAALRAEGKSLRTIAEEEGIGTAQTRRDLDEAKQLCPPGTVEPEKIIGKDGKERPSKQKPKEPSCPQPVTSIPAEPVRQAETAADGDEGQVDSTGRVDSSADSARADGVNLGAVISEAMKPAKVIPPPTVDGWGIPIQDHAKEAFAAVPEFKELVKAIKAAQKLFHQLADKPGGAFLRLPGVSAYRRHGKRDDGTADDRFINEGLETAAKQVANAMPTYTVCPYQYAEAGHPADCNTCLKNNWTPALSSSIPPACIERAKEAYGV